MSAVVVEAAVLAGFYGLMTLSLNLQYGLTGLLNFGQGFFFALGAVSVAFAVLHGLPVWLGIAAGPVLGVAGGVILALPAMRLGGDFWAFMTLAVAELFLELVQNQSQIAGGVLGTAGIAPVDPVLLLGILVAVTVLVVLAFQRIRRSQFGRVIRAIREDEVMVAALGRSVFRFRLTVMMIGGAVASVAGVAYAHWITYIDPTQFALSVTLLVWAGMIIGGLGNNFGAVLGAALLQSLTILTLFVPDNPLLAGEVLAGSRVVLIAIVMILVLLLRREGAVPERKVVYRADR